MGRAAVLNNLTWMRPPASFFFASAIGEGVGVASNLLWDNKDLSNCRDSRKSMPSGTFNVPGECV